MCMFLPSPVLLTRPVIMQLQANTTSIYLSWEEPADNNGGSSFYHITWQVVDDERGNTSLSTATNSSITTATELYVDGLTPFTVYSVQVVAVNREGISPRSEPMTVMTAEGRKCVCLFVHTCSIHDMLLYSGTVHVHSQFIVYK